MGIQNDTVRVGIMHPQSGAHAWSGLERIEAAEFAVASLEEHGVI